MSHPQGHCSQGHEGRKASQGIRWGQNKEVNLWQFGLRNGFSNNLQVNLTDRSRGRDQVTPLGPSIHNGVPRVAQPDTVASQTGGRKYSMDSISGQPPDPTLTRVRSPDRSTDLQETVEISSRASPDGN